MKDLVLKYAKQRVHPEYPTTQAQALVEAAFEKGKEGNTQILPYLLDRLFGKVMQPIEVTSLEALPARISEARNRAAAPPKEPEPVPPQQPTGEKHEKTSTIQ